MVEALLSVDSISVRFGGIVALDDVSFEVAESEICGLIGPNGAGKTTLFNCLSNIYRPQGGSIRFGATDLSGIPPEGIARIGIGRTFQNLALFSNMSVRENVATGGHCRTRAGFLDDAFRLPWVWREESSLQRRVEEILTFLDLLTVAERRVGDLPFSVQKRVDLGRALATEPRILLLDEPAAGLNHEEVDTLRSMIRALRDRRGKTVLLVEHHMNLVMSVSDHVVALDFGRKIADGSPHQVQSHPDVVRAYLGTAA